MLSMGNNRLIVFITSILLAMLLILLALTILVQANPGTRVPARDYGFYVYIGDQIVHGKLPYRDAWEYPPDNLQKFFKFVEENYYLEATLGEKAVYRLGQP